MKLTSKTEKTEPPEDTFNLIYILFFLLGLLHMLPWFFFTTATEYWMYKFRDPSSNDTDSKDRTDLQAEFNSVTNTTLQISNTVFLFLSMFFAHKIKVKTRLIFVLVMILILFIAITAFVEINTDSWQNGFFGLTMLIVAGINGTNSLFSITMYTALSQFPEKYLAPYLMGEGLAKIFSAALQILSLTLGLSEKNTAIVYFSCGDFIIGATLIVFIIATNTKFFSYHTRNLSREKDEEIVGPSEVVRLSKKIYPCIVIGICIVLEGVLSPTALVVSVDENDSDWNKYYFVPTITFFLEACCALIGRALVFKLKLNFSNTVWMLVSFLWALTFVPLFMFSNAQPRHHLPVVLQEDYQYIILQILNGIISGYLTNIMVVNIRTLADEDELKRAYHVYLTVLGILMASFSPLSVVSVKLL